MPKEPYVKPEVKSEILEAEALGNWGSSGRHDHPWIQRLPDPSGGLCCEE